MPPKNQSKQPLQKSFGAEFSLKWPKSSPDYKNNKYVLSCKNIKRPESVTIATLNKNSRNFPIKFPIETIRLSAMKSSTKELEYFINSTYPLIHERVLLLYSKFLEHKIKNGSKIEKAFYKDMSIIDLVQRLLEKRAVSFWGKQDKYKLLNGEIGAGGWDLVGKDHEKPPLLLQNCLSYDEQKLSALLSVSSHTEFINNGNRYNCGKPSENPNTIEKSGVIIGLIGTRLKRREVMEFQEIVIAKKQNTVDRGYGPADDRADDEVKASHEWRQIWADFFEEPNQLYAKVLKTSKTDDRFSPSKNKEDIFDNYYYKKRLTISFDTLLIEANARAKKEKKSAYIHVVGIGLGVWRVAEHQEKPFLDVFAQRIKYLMPKLHHVSDVHFAYFQESGWNEIQDGKLFTDDCHPNGGIKVFISKREPSSKLSSPDNEGKLLVVSYAWDGNALPGNEFWFNKLKTSGDPAAACSCQITELHNTHINKDMVSGNNLHVASAKYGVLHISDYVKKIDI